MLEGLHALSGTGRLADMGEEVFLPGRPRL